MKAIRDIHKPGIVSFVFFFFFSLICFGYMVWALYNT